MSNRIKPTRERKSVTSAFNLSGIKGYLTVGFYPDGQVCEVFIKVAKTGSTLQGVLDGMAIMISHALQYGMPLADVVDALEDMRFEPFGMTNDPDVPSASSLCDYIAKKLKHDYGETNG